MESDKRLHLVVKGEQLIASGISDTGRVRTENQDTIYLDEGGNYVLLADGMGGHERGAEASKTIIELLHKYLKPERILSELKDITNVEGVPAEIICLFSLIDKGVNRANTILFERNRREGLDRYMGTTLVGLVPSKGLYVTWFHVGDSRLYRFRDSHLTQLTTDHSAYAEWVRKGRSGEEPARNIVTRAIGPKEDVMPDIDWEEYQKDDLYILCSDGLNDMLTDEEISNIIKNNDDVDDITKGLVDAALDAGGNDNTSVVVCRV
jgi:serine/threonine protein phosphatase PrpC